MPAQSDTGSFFSETSNQNERILFTSESVGEGHPGKSLYLACFFLLNILHPPQSPTPHQRPMVAFCWLDSSQPQLHK